MPIYDYQCTSCGCKQEVMRKVSEPNVTVCPECGKETFARQVSAPSFQLSGSGWYATDFKGGSKKPADNGDKKADDSGNKSDTKEAAPAACGTGCACH